MPSTMFVMRAGARRRRCEHERVARERHLHRALPHRGGDGGVALAARRFRQRLALDAHRLHRRDDAGQAVAHGEARDAVRAVGVLREARQPHRAVERREHRVRRVRAAAPRVVGQRGAVFHGDRARAEVVGDELAPQRAGHRALRALADVGHDEDRGRRHGAPPRRRPASGARGAKPAQDRSGGNCERSHGAALRRAGARNRRFRAPGPNARRYENHTV